MNKIISSNTQNFAFAFTVLHSVSASSFSQLADSASEEQPSVSPWLGVCQGLTEGALSLTALLINKCTALFKNCRVPREPYNMLLSRDYRIIE